MRLPYFESEFAPDEVPDLTGPRQTNEALDAHVAHLPEHERIEISQQNLILNSVPDFYFAKYFLQKVSSADYEGDNRLPQAFHYLSHQLVKQAVISVATAIDLTSGRVVNGQKPPGRTASLPHLLERITKTLEDLNTDVKVELDLVAHIRKAVNPQAHLPLEYVQYMRNKWAGHASMDRRFDSWAETNDSVSIPAVEAALVRIVNAYEDFSALVEMSEALTDQTAKLKQVPTVNAAGHKTWTMTVDWSNIRVFARVQREGAQSEVDRFFKALSTSVD